MLRFDQVELRYPGGPLVLASVSFEVPAGQFCVVLGASGAGKSTLLRTVAGLAAPSAGRIEIDGVTVSPGALTALRRRIGMIHQQFGLVPRASVAVNLACGALPEVPLWRAMLGLFPAAVQRKACVLLAEVGLEEEHLARRAGELSGGQQQRVAIARAFMMDPVLVLADEPVASLDPKASRDILALLKREARERGTTVLCSLHQLELAREFADRVVALAQGRVVFDGPPSALDVPALAAVYGTAQSSSRSLARSDVVSFSRAV